MIFNVGRGNDNNALDADLPSVNACGVWSENCLLEVLVQQQLKFFFLKKRAFLYIVKIYKRLLYRERIE